MTDNSPNNQIATTHWRQHARRFWPDSLAARIAIILVAALLIAELVELFVGERERDDEMERAIEEAISTRLISIVAVWEETSDKGRKQLLEALNSPVFRVLHLDQPTPLLATPGWMEENVNRSMERFRAELGEGTIEFGTINTRKNQILDSPIQREFRWSWRYWFAVNIGVSDGYLLFALPVGSDIFDLDRRDHPTNILWWIALILLVYWAARRVTRPVRHFTLAADRLGVDVNAPPLPERGSRELRRATRAFNRMQQRVQRLISDRTQMIAAISHDLRTMLTRLRLRAEYIEDHTQKDKALSDIDTMEQMLTETLSFARDDSNKEERTRFDLGDMIKSLCEDFEDSEHPVAYHGPEKFAFHGRPVGLRRVFTNLISNAITYGNSADITLAPEEKNVTILVEDRGPGIPPEMREQVFAPFFRLEPSRNRETGGAGLGLSVARTIVRLHGGDIELSDREGGGLCVRIELPVVDQG